MRISSIFVFEYAILFFFALLFIVIYVKNTAARAYLSLALFSAISGFYILATAYLYVFHNPQTVRVFIYILYTAAFLILPAYLYFLGDMFTLGKTFKMVAHNAALALYVFAGILIVFLYTTDKFISFHLAGGTLHIRAEMFYYWFTAMKIIALATIIPLLVGHYLRFKNCKDNPFGIPFCALNLVFLLGVATLRFVPALRTRMPSPAPLETLPEFFRLHIPTNTLFILPIIAFLGIFFRRIKHLFHEITETRESIAVLLKRTKENTKEMIQTMVSTLEQRDPLTAGHSQRVADYAQLLGEAMGYPHKGLELLRTGALLHDIGKIGIPEKIIQNSTHINKEDLDFLHMHPVVGMEILSYIDEFLPMIDIVYYHHERYDGHGYPEGLCGEEIPEMARIVATCNIYDALTSYRVFGSRLSTKEACRALIREGGTQLDMQITKIFVKTLAKEKHFDINEIYV